MSNSAIAIAGMTGRQAKPRIIADAKRLVAAGHKGFNFVAEFDSRTEWRTKNHELLAYADGRIVVRPRI